MLSPGKFSGNPVVLWLYKKKTQGFVDVLTKEDEFLCVLFFFIIISIKNILFQTRSGISDKGELRKMHRYRLNR